MQQLPQAYDLVGFVCPCTRLYRRVSSLCIYVDCFTGPPVVKWPYRISPIYRHVMLTALSVYTTRRVTFITWYEIDSAGSQPSRGCEFESKLGQHSFPRLTKVTLTSVIHRWAKSLCGKAASCLEKDMSRVNLSPWYDWKMFKSGLWSKYLKGKYPWLSWIPLYLN